MKCLHDRTETIRRHRAPGGSHWRHVRCRDCKAERMEEHVGGAIRGALPWLDDKVERWEPFREGVLPGVNDPTVHGVFFNNLFQVTVRQVRVAQMGNALVDWLMIVRIDRQPIHDWRDLQRIKNELLGEEREACEIYPAESRLVDCSNQYHLFGLPDGGRWPFGYGERDVGDLPCGRNRQRPWAPDEAPDGLNERRGQGIHIGVMAPFVLRDGGEL